MRRASVAVNVQSVKDTISSPQKLILALSLLSSVLIFATVRAARQICPTPSTCSPFAALVRRRRAPQAITALVAGARLASPARRAAPLGCPHTTAVPQPPRCPAPAWARRLAS